jgi:hypothetical protein
VTLVEFKVWLNGFEQAMGGATPTAEQWKVIKGKLAMVELVRVTYRDTTTRKFGGVDPSQMADASFQRA